MPPNHDPRETEYFDPATPENNPNCAPVWSGVYRDSAVDEWLISVLLPIYDAEDRFIGILGRDLRLT